MVFSKVGPNQSIEWGQIRVSKSICGEPQIVLLLRLLPNVGRHSYRARSSVSSSLSKYASFPGTHDNIVPICLPLTCSSASLRSNSRPSISESSDMAQQVGPAPFDFSKRTMFSMPERCFSQGVSFGSWSTFHCRDAANRWSNQRKCESDSVNFLRFFGLARSLQNRSHTF